ncbi:hypothetical protein ES703_33370 [subsurface metagenome]
MGERKMDALRLNFDRKLKLAFHREISAFWSVIAAVGGQKGAKPAF